MPRELTTRPVPFELSLVQVGNSLRITIPKEVVRMLELAKGDMLELVVINDEIRLRPLKR